ncbi:unnamed protein product, partial [Sphacelaria rigidula]
LRCVSYVPLRSQSDDLVDSSVRTTVTISDDSPYDERTSGSGCSPNGCTPENTRDGDTSEESRWSCKYALEDTTCKVTYYFEEPQDIVELKVAFYKGDQRSRSLKIKLNGDTFETITSSGETTDLETWTLNSDETASLTLEASGLGDSEWLSITEVLLPR